MDVNYNTPEAAFVGATLRDIREESNIARTDFADLIGISPSHLTMMELGYRRPNAKYILGLLGLENFKDRVRLEGTKLHLDLEIDLSVA